MQTMNLLLFSGQMRHNGGLPNTCIHPSGRRAQGRSIVIVPSEPHDSTGSTVDTFLSQGDLGKTYELIPMPVIDE